MASFISRSGGTLPIVAGIKEKMSWLIVVVVGSVVVALVVDVVVLVFAVESESGFNYEVPQPDLDQI